MQGVPRVSSAPGQRFLPQSLTSARMGAVPLVGGAHQQRPFLSPVQMGQGAVQQALVPNGNDEPRAKGPAQQALERRRAWGLLKKLEAEELAVYLDGIAKRLDELNMPAGIIKKYRDKLQQFVDAAPAGAELEMTDAEVTELDAAILSYEEVEQQASNETAKILTIGAVSVAVIGIGVAVLL